jgi:hypothetical protein
MYYAYDVSTVDTNRAFRWLDCHHTDSLFLADFPYLEKYKELYGTTLLSLYVSPLIFVRRFMRSPCPMYLYVPHNILVFYAVCDVSKESRRSVLPRIP